VELTKQLEIIKTYFRYLINLIAFMHRLEALSYTYSAQAPVSFSTLGTSD